MSVLERDRPSVVELQPRCDGPPATKMAGPLPAASWLRVLLGVLLSGGLLVAVVEASAGSPRLAGPLAAEASLPQRLSALEQRLGVAEASLRLPGEAAAVALSPLGAGLLLGAPLLLAVGAFLWAEACLERPAGQDAVHALLRSATHAPEAVAGTPAGPEAPGKATSPLPPTSPPRSSHAASSLASSPFSTALLARSAGGVHVQLGGAPLVPHPERRTVDIVNMTDGRVILQTHVDETEATSSNAASIRVVMKAKRLTVATLDTRGAIFPEGGQPPPATLRRVVLHRAGKDGEVPGPACAWIAPALGGTFGVHTFGRSDVGVPALTVHARSATDDDSPAGLGIDCVTDAQGLVLARREQVEGGEALWIRTGVDVVLMCCIALAVRKLAAAAAASAP